MRLRRSFEGHQRGVSHIAWSPDSLHIIVCGPEDSSELIIWNTEVCTVYSTVSTLLVATVKPASVDNTGT